MGIFQKRNKRQQDGVDMTQPETMAEKIDDNSIEPMGVENNQKNKKNKTVSKAVFLLVLVVGLLLCIFSLMALTGKDEENQTALETPAVAIETDIEGKGSNSFNLNNDKDRIAEEDRKRREEEERLRLLKEQQDRENGVVTNPDGTQQPVVVQQQPPEEPKIDPILERRLGGGVLVNDGSNIGQPEQGNTAQASYGGGVPQGFGSESNSNERSLNFTGTTFAARVASKRGDRTLLLAKGTTIPCVLVTKIVTDHAGLTKCQAIKNVWSANGKTVLFERGTIFMGEQTAAMLQGQARIAVRWTQAETPKGIIVDIDSPSVGQLGASGNPAWVNHHFWKRFGGSIMISLIGDFSNGLSKRISRKSGSNDFTLEESADNMDEMATEALRNSINIPPTGTINQGALLNIMVARDIDFSQVYDRVDISEFDSLLP